MHKDIKVIRRAILKMAHESRSSHIGSCLSICEILYVLYFKILKIDPLDPGNSDRDLFVLSKAHASAALYATLAERGFFSKSWLDNFYVDGGALPGHLDKTIVPGLETSGGSLGHGLPIAIGMAIAQNLNGSTNKVYVLLGDGECNEGSVWEGAMLSSTLNLKNLTAIVDENGQQGFGKTNEIIVQQNLSKRWEAFGWNVSTIDGHDLSQIETSLAEKNDKPHVVIAKTIKGKGISFMEDKLEWHYRSPNDKEFAQALSELE